MKTLIGGAVAAVFGLVGLAIWFGELLQLLAGTIPIMLLIGGGLALYLGFDELKDAWTKKDSDKNDATTSVNKDDVLEDDVKKYKDEIEKLKSEIKDLRSDQS